MHVRTVHIRWYGDLRTHRECRRPHRNELGVRSLARTGNAETRIRIDTRMRNETLTRNPEAHTANLTRIRNAEAGIGSEARIMSETRMCKNSGRLSEGSKGREVSKDGGRSKDRGGWGLGPPGSLPLGPALPGRGVAVRPRLTMLGVVVGHCRMRAWEWEE